VKVNDKIAGSIDQGLLVLLGVARNDNEGAAKYLAEKISTLRVFDDANGRMNRSVLEIGGSVLTVPNFTLYGDCRKGRRPSFDESAKPEAAEPLFEYFVEQLRQTGVGVQAGIFRTNMQVELVNDGPVTFVIDSL
jgi:D-tyrosyl-tRNA(Tyr) deacylase